jgi:hypothetical protein
MHSRIALAPQSQLTDWPALFDAAEKHGGISEASSQAIGPADAVFQAMYLDLDAIQEALLAADREPAVVTVYADVLNIPPGFDWTLRQTALLIVARRIQSPGYATIGLDYRDGGAASLTVFADEVDGRFQAIALTAHDGPQPAVFIFDAPPATGGVQIHLAAGGPAETPLDRAAGLPVRPAMALEQALRMEFVFASLLRDQDPHLALAMFDWVKSWPGAKQIILEFDDSIIAQTSASRAALIPFRGSTMAATG